MINEILLLREELAHLWSNFTYAKKKKLPTKRVLILVQIPLLLRVRSALKHCAQLVA